MVIWFDTVQYIVSIELVGWLVGLDREHHLLVKTKTCTKQCKAILPFLYEDTGGV